MSELGILLGDMIGQATKGTSIIKASVVTPPPKLKGSGTFQGNGIYKSHKDIWFEDSLQKGDEVLVLVMGVHYVVVTKIVKMPSEAIKGV